MEVAAWVEKSCAKNGGQKNGFNDAMRHRRPEEDEEKARFAEQQKQLGRTDYLTYFDNLDADEARF